MSVARKRTRAVKPRSVVQRQRASLERLAARAGITREHLEALTERDTLNDLGHFLAQNKVVVDEFGSFAGLMNAHFENFVTKKMAVCDFWTDLADREHAIHLFAINAISKVAGGLPINWSYVTTLAQRHGLPIPTPDEEKMRAFLEAIPCAYLFDHEFNAFIEWNNASLAPCVFYNTLLLDSLTETAQLLSLSLEENRSFANLNEGDVSARSRVLVERLLGRQLLIRNPAVIEEPRSFLGTLGMALNAQMFVVSHELAHLLLGHSASSPPKRAEHEADMFATLVVGSSNLPNREFGIASVFALLDIIRADRPRSLSHPPPRDRVCVVGMQAAEAKAKIDWNYVCGVLKAVLNNAAEVCVGRGLFQECEEVDYKREE